MLLRLRKAVYLCVCVCVCVCYEITFNDTTFMECNIFSSSRIFGQNTGLFEKHFPSDRALKRHSSALLDTAKLPFRPLISRSMVPPRFSAR